MEFISYIKLLFKMCRVVFESAFFLFLCGLEMHDCYVKIQNKIPLKEYDVRILTVFLR